MLTNVSEICTILSLPVALISLVFVILIERRGREMKNSLWNTVEEISVAQLLFAAHDTRLSSAEKKVLLKLSKFGTLQKDESRFELVSEEKQVSSFRNKVLIPIISQSLNKKRKGRVKL